MISFASDIAPKSSIVTAVLSVAVRKAFLFSREGPNASLRDAGVYKCASAFGECCLCLSQGARPCFVDRGLLLLEGCQANGVPVFGHVEEPPRTHAVADVATGRFRALGRFSALGRLITLGASSQRSNLYRQRLSSANGSYSGCGFEDDISSRIQAEPTASTSYRDAKNDEGTAEIICMRRSRQKQDKVESISGL